MTPGPRKQLVRREVLDHASRPLLLRYLAPFTDFFAAHGLDPTALADASPAATERIFAALHDAEARPHPKADLIVALETLDALATPDAAAEMMRLDRERVLPRGTLGDADLALVALLDHPEIAAMARATSTRDPDHKFVEYAPARSASSGLVFDDATLERFRDGLAEKLHAMDHTSFCRVHALGDRGRVDLEIVHGSRPKTRDVVSPGSKQLARVTDVTARRSFVRLDRATGRLAVRAPFPAIRECIRASLGRALANDERLFTSGGLYDLAGFRDLARVLAIDGVEDLLSVELRALKVVTADEVGASFARPRKDALASPAGRRMVELALELGQCVSVLLYLHVKKRPAIRLELAADGKNNVVKYDRDDPAVAHLVLAYLRERGILRSIDAGLGESRDAELAHVASGDA